MHACVCAGMYVKVSVEARRRLHFFKAPNPPHHHTKTKLPAQGSLGTVHITQRWFPCTGTSWLWPSPGSKEWEGGRQLERECDLAKHLGASGLRTYREWKGCVAVLFCLGARLRLLAASPHVGLRLFSRGW